MGRTIWIPMGDFRLEAEVHVPEGSSRAPAAVIAHPDPQYGGDMHNNVVAGIYEGLARRGRAVLRFNFRGVGRSGGTLGEGGAEDIEAAVEVLAKAACLAKRDVAIAGYSFGAAMAAACMGRGVDVAAWIGIAPPVAFTNLPGLARCGRPVYLLCGDADDYCPAALAEELLETCAPPKGLAIAPGADHSLRGFEEAVAAQVELFLVEAARAGTSGQEKAPLV
jgi:alpha/beta superfamily hydrolase